MNDSRAVQRSPSPTHSASLLSISPNTANRSPSRRLDMSPSTRIDRHTRSPRTASPAAIGKRGALVPLSEAQANTSSAVLDVQRENTRLQFALTSAEERESEADRRTIRAQSDLESLRVELDEHVARERNANESATTWKRKAASMAAVVEELKAQNDTNRKDLEAALRGAADRTEADVTRKERDERVEKLVTNLQEQVSNLHEQLAESKGLNAELEERLHRATLRGDERETQAIKTDAAVARYSRNLAVATAAITSGAPGMGMATALDESTVTSPQKEAGGQLRPEREGFEVSDAEPEAIRVRRALAPLQAALADTSTLVDRLRRDREAADTRAAADHSAYETSAEALAAALRENSALAAKVHAQEVANAKLEHEATRAQRDAVALQQECSSKLLLVGELLGCPGEWGAVEAMAGAISKDRDKLREDAATLRERCGRLNAEVATMASKHDEDVRAAVLKIRDESERAAAEARKEAVASIAQEAQHRRDLHRDRVAAGLAERLHNTELNSEASRQEATESMLAMGKERDDINAKYQTAVSYVKELERENARLRATIAATEVQQASAAAPDASSIRALPLQSPSRVFDRTQDISAVSGRGATPTPGVGHTASITNPAVEPTVVLEAALVALNGAWRDVAATAAERNALYRMLRQIDGVLKSPNRTVGPKRHPLVRFRAAAVAVIACLRLASLRQGSSGDAVEPSSSRRRGTPRLWIRPDSNTQELVLPQPAAWRQDAVGALRQLVASTQPPMDIAANGRKKLLLADGLRDGLMALRARAGPDALAVSLPARIANIISTNSTGPTSSSLGAAPRGNLRAADRVSGEATPSSYSAQNRLHSAGNSPTTSDVPRLIRPVPSKAASAKHGWAAEASPARRQPQEGTPQRQQQSSSRQPPVYPMYVSRTPSTTSPNSGGPTPFPVTTHRSPHSRRGGSQSFLSDHGNTKMGASPITEGTQTPQRPDTSFGTDEFAHEVLNVIKALDARVGGALKRSVYTPERQDRSAAAQGSQQRPAPSRSRSQQW